MIKHPRADLYLADRATGMKYHEIAKKHGVSYQSVAQACARYSSGHFRPYTSQDVIYPNLRKWLNENKVNRYEFTRRLGCVYGSSKYPSLRSWFRGETFPQKKTIDKILDMTGLTYEELWEVDAE